MLQQDYAGIQCQTADLCFLLTVAASAIHWCLYSLGNPQVTIERLDHVGHVRWIGDVICKRGTGVCRGATGA